MNRLTEKFPWLKADNAWMLCALIAVVLFLLSFLGDKASGGSDKFAPTAERRVEKRMKILDSFVEKALNQDPEEWLLLKNLPEDMVIYRYEYDTLQSWCNQFPIMNDNIASRMVFQTLTNLRTELVSPLTKVTEEPSYMNLGQKWYIVKYVTDGVKCKLICGLEVKDNWAINFSKSSNGINPALKIPDKYNITPLSNSGGTAICIGGEPVFKLINETFRDAPRQTSIALRWFALLFAFTASIIWLIGHRSLMAFAVESVIIGLCSTISYMWGRELQSASEFFSPTIYADGAFLYSFGALMIVNIAICMVIFCLFAVRNRIFFRISHQGQGKKIYRIIYGITVTAMIVILLIHINYSISSLIKNSGISLDMYSWSSLSWYSLFTYLSYAALFYSLLLLIQMLRPVFQDLFKLRYTVFSQTFLLISTALFAFYMTAMSANLGFEKELNRINVWTNRLAVERDLALEIQLKSVEEMIASDHVIAALSENDRHDAIILHRLVENYFYSIIQDYDVSVALSRENSNSTYEVMGQSYPVLEYFSRKMMTASAISGSTRFVYIREPNGSSSYIGTFVYYSEHAGLVHMFIEITAKSYRNETGYSSILDRLNKPDEVNMPQFYSFAKYISGKLVSSRGNYPYPTVMDREIEKSATGVAYFRANKYIHFVNPIPTDEVIIISRSTRGVMTYFITFSYLVIFMYILFYLVSIKARKEKTGFMRNYYRSSINTLLFIALSLTLVIMAIVSVTFVFTRNENNMYNLMSNKISTIQALMEARCSSAKDFRELSTPEFLGAMENIANTTESDITMFTPSGRAFRSTAPEVFDKMLLGFRMNQEAYYNITYRHQRFYIGREDIAGRKVYSLYAPIINSDGETIVIINSPYTDQNSLFKRDAFFHGAIIISFFIILLFGTLFVSTAVVNAMFKPLLAIGKKMESTDIQNLDYISYTRKDEISTLVEAYNKMAKDLSESTRKLAQSERNQAWNEMSRQIAHEIKNPLTPIKLAFQRLIRLKGKNDPNWNEKFDKEAEVILEHIDILTETANEFSSFAKLYGEEPTRLDLDEILRDQIMIFDNKDNITISYMGMSDAWTMAPKSQIIRVFVNIITNAIQAIENMQKEMEDRSAAPVQGRILIALRNSSEDGFYDIAFDDNGPGVPEENLGKLFDPSFTTKTSGTGLGLAICRNIVEKWDGEINYQKSFALGGASFIVKLPKIS